MLGLLIWPFVIWYGTMTERFWPGAVIASAVVGGALTMFGFMLRPDVGVAALAANFAIKSVLALLMFSIGFAVGKAVRRRRAGRSVQPHQ